MDQRLLGNQLTSQGSALCCRSRLMGDAGGSFAAAMYPRSVGGGV